MLPIQGIETQSVNPLYLPGNTFYVFSVERIIWRGSHVRECVFGGASVPRFVFLPIVDFPLMGKNYNPVGNYGQAAAEVSMSTQIANASRLDGGLPMTRKLAIHCVQELVENYQAMGLAELPALHALTREQVGQVYLSVLPQYITQPALTGIRQSITPRGDGKQHFDVNAVVLLDSKGQESELDLQRLFEELQGKNYNKSLAPELHEIAAKTQASIATAVENAMAHRRAVIDRETGEVAASKTNGGRGLTAYTHLAKKYAISLNLELIDPVVVQRKEFIKESTFAAAPAPVESANQDKLADALNNFAAAIGSMQMVAAPVVPVPVADVTPKTKKTVEKPTEAK